MSERRSLYLNVAFEKNIWPWIDKKYNEFWFQNAKSQRQSNMVLLQVLHHACTHGLNEKAVKTVVSCYVE